jgi:hypothetical protein
MHDGQAITDAAGLVDGEIIIPRPDGDLGTAAASNCSALTLPSPAAAVSEDEPPNTLEPRPDVNDESPQPETPAAKTIAKRRAAAGRPRVLDCVIIPYPHNLAARQNRRLPVPRFEA